jgi:hypothetical protein
LRGAVEIKEVVDATAEDGSEFGKDVGTRGFFATFPEGDVGLGFANEASEFCLGKAGGLTELEKTGALAGAGFREFAWHTPSVSVVFVMLGLEGINRLHK